jgi:hypothetical protein
MVGRADSQQTGEMHQLQVLRYKLQSEARVRRQRVCAFPVDEDQALVARQLEFGRIEPGG